MFKSVIKIHVEVCFCTKPPTHRTSSDYMLNPKHELIYHYPKQTSRPRE